MTDATLRNTYVVVEVQVNNGTAAAAQPVVCSDMNEALGEMYVKLGYAYQNPRDFTFVSILDSLGNVIENRVFDNRTNKTDIYTLVELQGANGAITVAPIVINDTLAAAMYAFHNTMAYAWNVRREYTCGVILDTAGYKSKVEIQQ